MPQIHILQKTDEQNSPALPLLQREHARTHTHAYHHFSSMGEYNIFKGCHELQVQILGGHLPPAGSPAPLTAERDSPPQAPSGPHCLGRGHSPSSSASIIPLPWANSVPTASPPNFLGRAIVRLEGLRSRPTGQHMIASSRLHTHKQAASTTPDHSTAASRHGRRWAPLHSTAASAWARGLSRTEMGAWPRSRV